MNKRKILKLLQEPSTYAGLAALLGGSAIWGMSEGDWMQVAGVLMAVAGAAAAITIDPGDKD